MSQFLFIRLVNDIEGGRSWNGNDEKAGRTWHGFIPEGENPTDIKLQWQTNTAAPLRYIGTYRLNLTELLKAGYIKTKSKGGKEGFEVECIHAHNDCIYIQTNKNSCSPRLAVGMFE